MSVPPGAPLRLESTSPESTRRLGGLLSGVLRPGDLLLLSGGLGAGKTTLVKGLVAALGGEEEVTSPTFTLCRTYGSDPVVAHVDCWRLEQLQEVVDLALDELLDAGAIVVVEWGEAVLPLLGADALLLTLSGPGEPGREGERRLVEIEDPSGRFAGPLTRLAERFASGQAA